MDYKSWSQCEAVPLSNGTITRRTGLQFMKSPEEISAYYLQHFGTYWFNELPKTDNTYNPTSEYYGCTLAPGIPLIPNLCRRPLRSPGTGDYDYTFNSSYQSAVASDSHLHSQTYFSEENQSNHLIERNNFNNHATETGNGTTHRHMGTTQLPRRKLTRDLQDSGVDSDSDYEDVSLRHHQGSLRSQNSVTWLGWIITMVTTVITTITNTVTETFASREDHQNYINTRVPLKHGTEVAWYQYPFLWLYQMAMWVHRMDILILHKVNSVLRVDSWGTPQQRRRWALVLLLIPLILWAGYKFLEWLWDEDPLKEGVSLAWLLYPLFTVWELMGSAWGLVTAWTSDAWGVMADSSSNAWSWFDGSWLWAPWVFVASWFEKSSDSAATDNVLVDDTSEPLVEMDWSGALSWITWPYYSLLALFTSSGEYLTSAASSLGEGSTTMLSSVSALFGTTFSSISAFLATVFSSIGAFLAAMYSSIAAFFTTVFYGAGTFLAAVFAWIVDLVAGVPALCSTAFAFIAYPFKSATWSSPVSYTAEPPTYYSADSVPAAPIMPPAPAPASVSVDVLLQDKQLMSQVLQYLLRSEEFEASVARAVVSRAATNQEQSNRAFDAAIAQIRNEAKAQIEKEIDRVKEELSGKVAKEDIDMETQMDFLKQKIHKIEEEFRVRDARLLEQAELGKSLLGRISNTEKVRMQEDIEIEKLKNLFLQEVESLREEVKRLSASHQNVVVNSEESLTLSNPTELEGLINSTVERLLAVYDADKIAKVDYALATSGGSVLSVRCTETYTKKNAQYYMWGYPLWSKSSNDPKIALEPAINPGECWAFTGSRGYLVIELSENITVTAFTMEHLPRSLSPTGNIDTAPKDFRVMGLQSEQDETPIMLGRFRYEDNGISLQHFIASEVDHAFKIVELVIESNHGNLEYTCLYRFRVHGRPVRT